jgi:hypothetical protein
VRTFSLLPVPGVLTDRELVVEVVAAGGGQTAIRVDAEGGLAAAAPAGRARAVRRPGGDGRRRASRDARRRPAASCPAFLAPGVRLTFRTRPGGPALAVAEGPASCGTLLFTVGSRQQPALQVTDGFVRQVLAIAGLRCRLSWIGAFRSCHRSAQRDPRAVEKGP